MARRNTLALVTPTESEFADRAHEFPHMSRSALADFTRRQLQIVKSNAYEFELGQSVVPRRVRCRRCLRELQELLAPMAAFSLQLTLNSVLVDEEIMTTPSHRCNLLLANRQVRRRGRTDLNFCDFARLFVGLFEHFRR